MLHLQVDHTSLRASKCKGINALTASCLAPNLYLYQLCYNVIVTVVVVVVVVVMVMACGVPSNHHRDVFLESICSDGDSNE